MGCFLVLHHCPVDFQLVGRERQDLFDRRVPYAEVIDRNAHAEFAEPAQPSRNGRAIRDESRLGDLKRERAGAQVSFAQSPLKLIEESTGPTAGQTTLTGQCPP